MAVALGVHSRSANLGTPRTGYAFQAFLSDVEPGSALRIVRLSEGDHGSEEVWVRKAHGEPPRIGDVSVRIAKEGRIDWDVISAAETLEFSIQYSKDKGKSWNGLAAGIRERGYRFPLDEMPSGDVIFRVLAHDGFYSTYADSKPVRTRPRPPVVSILHPNEGRTYQAGLPLRLAAAVNTQVGAKNDKLELSWFLDDKAVGEGMEYFLTAPEPGRHQCRLVARDDGGESEARVTFTTVGEASRTGRGRPTKK